MPCDHEPGVGERERQNKVDVGSVPYMDLAEALPEESSGSVFQ